MDVTAAGTVSPNRPDSLAPPRPLAVLPPQLTGLTQTADQIAGSLEDLAGPQIGQLLTLLDRARASQDPMLLDGLLKGAVAAVHTHRMPEAMKALQHLITLNPDRGLSLIHNEPRLASVRHEIGDLMQRLTMGAKAEAERTILTAAMAVEISGRRIVEPAGVSTQDLVALARRFMDSGQYLNYVRATELGHMVLATDRARARSAVTTPQLLRMLWRRAPLLVLLMGWLAVGLIGRYTRQGPLSSGAVEIWATGFLALVLIQFFATVRNFR